MPSATSVKVPRKDEVKYYGESQIKGNQEEEEEDEEDDYEEERPRRKSSRSKDKGWQSKNFLDDDDLEFEFLDLK